MQLSFRETISVPFKMKAYDCALCGEARVRLGRSMRGVTVRARSRVRHLLVR